jgi:hypothetical protein
MAVLRTVPFLTMNGTVWYLLPPPTLEMSSARSQWPAPRGELLFDTEVLFDGGYALKGVIDFFTARTFPALEEQDAAVQRSQLLAQRRSPSGSRSTL